jgi:hypothetical protein
MKYIKHIVVCVTLVAFVTGCNVESPTKPKPQSDSGVSKVSAKVKVQANGRTVEQDNVKKRIEAENMPGAVKHLYIISAMSGQTIIYSTVKGKVTSSGKRLTGDKTFARGRQGGYGRDFIVPRIQDDGTYGSSIPYLYWWDVQGRYHQHYVSGGQIIHVSDEPMPVKSVIINLETVK